MVEEVPGETRSNGRVKGTNGHRSIDETSSEGGKVDAEVEEIRMGVA